jgi:hypothetical protein
MDKRGRGRPRDSRPGGRRYIPFITNSCGHGTNAFSAPVLTGINGQLCYPTLFAKNAERMGHGASLVLSHPFRKERGKDGARSFLCAIPPFPQRTRKGWGTEFPLCYPTLFAKNAERMGHGASFVLSHPFRKERGKDGARSFLCAIPPFPQRTRKGWGTELPLCYPTLSAKNAERMGHGVSLHYP